MLFHWPMQVFHFTGTFAALMDRLQPHVWHGAEGGFDLAKVPFDRSCCIAGINKGNSAHVLSLY